jgi:hypothetical protein
VLLYTPIAPCSYLQYILLLTVAAAAVATPSHWSSRRGKRSQKHYTVFVADVKPLVLASYTPNLNLAEHSEWRWWSWESVVAAVAGEGAAGGEMHPVVKKLVEEHSAEVEHVLQSCVQ